MRKAAARAAGVDLYVHSLPAPPDTFRLCPTALRRVRAPPAQTGLGREDRRANVRGAFGSREPLEALSVLLVDDVMSTGSTGMECARALRHGGVRQVVVATVALALLDY